MMWKESRFGPSEEISGEIEVSSQKPMMKQLTLMQVVMKSVFQCCGEI
jgi:hypothetical protein